LSGQQGTPAENAVAVSYQRVLMLLPRSYREQRGEEILGTLLDAAQDEGRSRPAIKEILSILSLSLILRTGAPGGGTRAEAFGALLRRVALAGLLLQSAIYVVYTFGLAQEADAYWRFGNSGGSAAHYLAVAALYEAVEEAVAVLAVSLALLSLASGRRRSGLALAAVGPLSMVVGVSVRFGDPFSPGLTWSTNGTYLALLGLGLLSLIAAALGFHQADATRSARRWIIALIAVDGVLLAVNAIVGQTHLDIPGIQFLLPTICVVPAVAFAAWAARSSPIWPLALLATGAPGLALLPRTITDLGEGMRIVGPGVSGTSDALGTESLIGEVLFAGILAWSLYRHRATRDVADAVG
jgi:hypothetical protein